MGLTIKQRVKVNAALSLIHAHGYDAQTVVSWAQEYASSGYDVRRAYERALNDFGNNQPDTMAGLSKVTRLVEASDVATVAKYDVALAAYIATVRDGTNDGRAMRVAGEPIWTGLSPVEIAEWACVESACNVAFADSRLTMFCPYDTSVLDPAIIDVARRTHPELRSDGRTATSDHYSEPLQFHSMIRTTDMPPRPDEYEECSIATAAELWRIQLFIDAFSELHALSPKLTNDLRAFDLDAQVAV